MVPYDPYFWNCRATKNVIMWLECFNDWLKPTVHEVGWIRRKQGWCNSESTGLPPMWCGFNFLAYGLSLLVHYKILRGVSLGTQAFSSPKTNIWFDLICVNSVWFVSPISKTHVPGYKKWYFDKVTIIIIIIIIIIRSHCPQMSEIDSNLVLPSFSTSNC